ncbi:hypothetical protein [[Limnothrix rosea] IAM M-220]|uniref:hypothetical protein n=1 Tax=[Limnothrix rosea] IAM M-220 TaxID=454133 RepID=UPI000964FCF7|nr:hypothetical protein [[Limnothrix rosea] IAM M-220]OKH16842.1 hypothetical protein NIES208_11625 [[Limnothrix rosea] IAM M-220]
MTTFSSKLTFAAAACGAFLLAAAPAIAQSEFTITSTGSGISISANGQPISGQISGTAGGNKDSGGCGWISNQANHTFSVNANSMVSMKIQVNSPSGQTNIPYTLMIKDANNPEASSFCAIAAPGIPAEISGVWSQEGNYQIFVGNFESSSNRDSYVLSISD